MRVVEPVCLTSEVGEKLAGEVAQTLQILGRFQKAGFSHAVWVVDTLSTNQVDLTRWATDCLKAFPVKPILALDMPAEGESSDPNAVRIKKFLESVLPNVHSAILNWDKVNNRGQHGDLSTVGQSVTSIAKLARSVSPKTFLWLRVDDSADALANLQNWVNPLAGSVDGYWLTRWHEWNAGNEQQYITAVKAFLSSGKPVMRGGFRYSCPRARRGIEEDLTKSYQTRLPIYEKWVAESGYAGYSRAIGDAIPGKVNPNQNFLTDLK